jgi:hypothetical protein
MEQVPASDVLVVSSIARMLAVLEAIVGTFYMTMLIARLVTLYSSESRPDNAGSRDAGSANVEE